MTAETEATEESQPRDLSWSPRNPARAAAAYAAAYLVVALLGAAVVAILDSPIVTVLVVTLAAAVVLLLSLLMVLSLCRIRLGAAAEVGWMLGAVVVFCFSRPVVFAIVGRWLGAQAAGERLETSLSIIPGQALVGNLALIIWAVLLGRLVSRIIKEGKLLLPVAVVASVADIFTVFWGVVKEVGEKAPEVVEAFSAQAPVAPPPEMAAPILTAVGIGDFLFLALFLSVALRYSMNASGALWATFALMLVAPLAFMIWPEATGLPGLPFISLAVLGVNWRYLKFTPDEKRSLRIAGVLVAVAAVGLWAMLRK